MRATAAAPATFADLEAAYLRHLAERPAQRQSIRKAERMFTALKTGFGDGSLSQLDDDAISERLERFLLQCGLARGSLLSWQKILHAMRVFGRAHGFLERYPTPLPDRSSPEGVRRYGRPDIEEPLTDREAQRLFHTIEQSKDSFVGGRDYLLLELAMFHGVKPIAALNLNVSDVAVDCASVRLRGRTGMRPRSVNLGKRAQRFLAGWLQQPRVKESGFLFPGRASDHWTSHARYVDRYSVRLKSHCKTAQLRPINYRMVLRYNAQHRVSGLAGFDPEVSPDIAGPRPAAAISESGELFLYGRSKGIVSEALCDATRKFLSVFPQLLSETKSNALMGCTTWRNTLRRHRAKDKDYRRAYVFPGKGGPGNKRGYGINVWRRDVCQN
jgi:integrase